MRTRDLHRVGVVAASTCTVALIVACAETSPTTSAQLNPGAQPALSTGIPTGGCPGHFSLRSMQEPYPGGTTFKGPDDVDRNGDGFFCALVLKEATKESAVILRIDNNVPADQVGKCAETFEAVLVASGTAEDRNGNNLVCRGAAVDGEVVTDDNFVP